MSDSESYCSDGSDDSDEGRLLATISKAKKPAAKKARGRKAAVATKLDDTDEESDDEAMVSIGSDDSDSSFDTSELKSRSKVSKKRPLSGSESKRASVAKKPKVVNRKTTPTRTVPTEVEAKPKQTGGTKSAGSRKKTEAPSSLPTADAFDIVLPNNAGSEISILVQVDPDDAAKLDFTGAVGAIGRLETDASGVTLDLKGTVYRGSLFPGPTALVLTGKPFQKSEESQQLRVDGIVDEFCRLVKESDQMAKLAGTVKGDMLDYSYQYQEEDVNRRKDAVVPEKQSGKGKTSNSKRTSVGKKANPK